MLKQVSLLVLLSCHNIFEGFWINYPQSSASPKVTATQAKTTFQYGDMSGVTFYLNHGDHGPLWINTTENYVITMKDVQIYYDMFHDIHSVIFGEWYPTAPSGSVAYHANYNIGDWLSWTQQQSVGQTLYGPYYNPNLVPVAGDIANVNNPSTYMSAKITAASSATTSTTTKTTAPTISNQEYLYSAIGNLYAGFCARTVGQVTPQFQNFLSYTNNAWDQIKDWELSTISNTGAPDNIAQYAFSFNINMQYTLWLQDPHQLKNLAVCFDGGSDNNIRNFGAGFRSTRSQFGAQNGRASCTYMTEPNGQGGYGFTHSPVLAFYHYADPTLASLNNANFPPRFYAAPYGQFFGVTFPSLYNAVAYDGGYQGTVFTSGQSNSYVLDTTGSTITDDTLGTQTVFCQPMSDFLSNTTIVSYLNNSPFLNLQPNQANYILHHLSKTAARLAKACLILKNGYNLKPMMRDTSSVADLGVIVNVVNNTNQTFAIYQENVSASATQTGVASGSSGIQIGQINPGRNEIDINLAGLMPVDMSSTSSAYMLKFTSQLLQNNSEIHIRVMNAQDLYNYIQKLGGSSAPLLYNGQSLSLFSQNVSQADIFLVLETFITNSAMSDLARIQIVDLSNFVESTNNKPYLINLAISGDTPDILSDNILTKRTQFDDVYYISCASIKSMPDMANMPMIVAPVDLLQTIPLLNVYWVMHSSAYIAALTDFACGSQVINGLSFDKNYFGNAQAYYEHLGYFNQKNIYIPVIDLQGSSMGIYDTVINTGVFSYSLDVCSDLSLVNLYQNSQGGVNVNADNNTMINFVVDFDLDKPVGITSNLMPSDPFFGGLYGMQCITPEIRCAFPAVFSLSKNRLQKGVLIDVEPAGLRRFKVIMKQNLTKAEQQSMKNSIAQNLLAQAQAAGQTVTQSEINELLKGSEVGVLAVKYVNVDEEAQNIKVSLKFLNCKNSAWNMIMYFANRFTSLSNTNFHNVVQYQKIGTSHKLMLKDPTSVVGIIGKNNVSTVPQKIKTVTSAKIAQKDEKLAKRVSSKVTQSAKVVVPSSSAVKA